VARFDGWENKETTPPPPPRILHTTTCMKVYGKWTNYFSTGIAEPQVILDQREGGPEKKGNEIGMIS